MSTSIDTAFVKQYEREVHEAFQRQGSLLRNTVRLKSGIVGASTTFQVVGRGVAGQKSRHGLVPVMNLDHSVVEVTLQDWYAGEWVDKLDELKINHDERGAVVNAASWALGRKVDERIVTAARASLPSGQKIAEASSGLTKQKVLAAIELLATNDVPDDGQRYALVGPHQWSELMNLTEFKDADIIGSANLPWLGGRTARSWLNCTWMQHTGLPVTSGTRFCLIYHRSVIGWAEGQDIVADVTWHGDRAAHFFAHSLSGEAVRIDPTGIVEIACDDDAAIS